MGLLGAGQVSSERNYLNALGALFFALLMTACGSKKHEGRRDVGGVKSGVPRATETAKEPPPTASSGKNTPLTLRWKETRKIEQIIGDEDRETKKPTKNLTETRFGVKGTDLGYSFEHRNEVVLLFGDTIDRGGDSIATSTSSNGDLGLQLNFITDEKNKYLKIQAPGISMKGFEVPVSGISLKGTMYVALKTDHTEGASTDRTVLAEYRENEKTFSVLRELSKLPEGRFSKLSMHLDVANGQANEVYMWGTGQYRSSHVYLAKTPVDAFVSGKSTHYFCGYSGASPKWCDSEREALAIVEDGTVGDISVTWVEAIKHWIMTYDSRAEKGVVFRYSPSPWGPWSKPEVIFNAEREGAIHKYIHAPSATDDGVAGPIISKKGDAQSIRGGAYAPYVVERFSKLVKGPPDTLAIYYVLSTWNPYVVVLMKTSLLVE